MKKQKKNKMIKTIANGYNAAAKVGYAIALGTVGVKAADMAVSMATGAPEYLNSELAMRFAAATFLTASLCKASGAIHSLFVDQSIDQDGSVSP